MDMKIEIHVIYISANESQLGQSPDVMKVGLASGSTWRATAQLLCSCLAPAITSGHVTLNVRQKPLPSKSSRTHFNQHAPRFRQRCT